MGEKRRGLPVWLWVIVALPLSCFTLVVLVTLGAYVLFRQVDSTDAEARRVLTTWSAGLLRCAQRDRELPPSSSPVPATLGRITGKTYQSAPGEWNEPAHTCAGFALSEPQEFQYSWLRRSPDDGVLEAVAADSSGRAGAKLEVEITCQAGQCTSTAAALADTAAARERSFKRASHDFVVKLFETAGSNHRSLTYSLASLATIVGFIWLMAAGFSVSVGWGFAVALLPCLGGVAFAISRWDEAKRPFFCWSLGWGISVLAAALNPAPVESQPAQTAAAEARASSATPPERAPPPPPVPTAAPIPALDGAAVDLSTLMGRARKLADVWQTEAALLGIEATLVDGKVQPQAGGTAKINFGPSRFAATPAQSGLFVVTYDKLGLASGPAKGAAGKALAEPMCAPEGLQSRLDDLKGTPYGLRYALAPDQRPSWLVTSPTQPKLVRVFDPQDCGVRASVQLRGNR
jgi:hypothetical protein